MQSIAYGLVILIVALLAYAASRPSAFRIQRSARMNAAPDRIYPHIADFGKWTAWSPYEKLDPDMKKTYGGTPGAVGATYAWEGNSKAGKGRMEVTNAAPPTQLVMNLDFEKPFVAHNVATFTLQPGVGGTDVTWAMDGHNGFMFKLMGIFMNMDNMIGKDFATGLANLKAMVES